MSFWLNRRQFLDQTYATLAAGSLLGLAAPRRLGFAQGPSSAHERWYTNVYRRAVIDMHIPDWDERFLSEFDPERYADALVEARSESVVCYCQSHVGLFNYPTKIGRQHKAWNGRNVFQQMIDAVHKRGINVQVYTSLIFDRWCGDEHPEWRMRHWDGRKIGEGGRHCMLCINSPYRDYVRNWVQEICEEFEFEGIRFDMTFWPGVCYCNHCEDRFAEEVGGEIPQTINWLDEKWVAFQRARERWLVEFAKIATDTVKTCQPGASIEHQSSTFPKYFGVGVTADLADQNTFLQGDFYGDALQGSFVRKLLSRLSPHQPFGYETSASVRLQDHTALKSEALLEAKASSAIADNAAFIFIDAIDPIGTVNLRAHQRMGKIFDRLMPYYQHLGGKPVVDVGIYYSFESKFDMADNGKHIENLTQSDTHTMAAMNAASRLMSRQRLLGVLTKDSLDDLDNLQVLILCNVNMMDQQECSVIRQWVRGGGKLLATGGTSLVDKAGKLHDDFILADVFGVSLAQARWDDWRHYITPTLAGSFFFPGFTEKYPAYSDGRGHEIRALEGATVLATTTLPWPRDDRTRFSSIHSDPPWIRTENPEIVSHQFGAGQVIYCASLIENLDELAETFVRLVDSLDATYRLEATAPKCIEVTMFHQPERHRYRVSLVNFQSDLPNIPVDGIELRLRVPETVKAVKLLPGGEKIALKNSGDQTVFKSPTVETLRMFEVSY